MKHFILFLLFFCGFRSFAQKQLVVDPDAEVRALSGSFKSIKVSSGINVYLSKADDEALAVSAPGENKQEIKTEIENGELHISYSGERIRFNNRGRVNVYVAYKELEQLYASGASEVIVAGEMELPLLNVQLSGASTMKGALNIGELNIRLSGASDMKITGKAKTVNIISNSASDVKDYGFVAEICNIKVSGASDVNITVTKELYADASGASDVHFKGSAEIKEKQTSGASSIARVE